MGIVEIDLKVLTNFSAQNWPTEALFTLPALMLLSFEAQGCKELLKTILTLPCWYSLDRSHWVLSDQGSTFPGAQGHMPLDFAVGP